jgi:hypothetical protein
MVDISSGKAIIAIITDLAPKALDMEEDQS